VRLSLALEVWLGQDGVITRTDERLCNLSVGGAHIESGQRYPLESVLNLRFKLPHTSDFITCTAMVRHTSGTHRLGVEFLDLSPDDCYRIKSFIEHQLISEALQQTRRVMRQAAAQLKPESALENGFLQGRAGGKSMSEAGE